MKPILIFACLISYFSKAQLQTLDVAGSGAGGYGTVKYNNFAELGKKGVKDISYSDVRGKYLWDEEWNLGLLILKGGNAIKLKNVKLNLYTSELNYLDKDLIELTANPGLVKKVFLYSKSDTTKMIGSFISLIGLAKDNKEHFFQVLNEGNLQLLKVNLITIRKSDYDPMLGRSELTFVSNVDYYLKDSSGITALKGLNKSTLSSKIKLNEASENWLKKNDNRLKSEQDVVSLLTFLNAQN